MDILILVINTLLILDLLPVYQNIDILFHNMELNLYSHLKYLKT